jgi:hypothetical protein
MPSSDIYSAAAASVPHQHRFLPPSPIPGTTGIAATGRVALMTLALLAEGMAAKSTARRNTKVSTTLL